MPSQAAAGVTTICAAEKTVLNHEPSSKPRPSAPLISARPWEVRRTLSVEIKAPIITAIAPMAGYSEPPTVDRGSGGAAAVAGPVKAAAVWYR